MFHGEHDDVWDARAERPGRWSSGRMKRRSKQALQEENPSPVASDGDSLVQTISLR
jgi:hypothetical protein